MSTQIKIDLWENDRLIVKEVTPNLRVSRVTVWRWRQQGLIPASHASHCRRIRQKDLLCLLETSNLSISDPNYHAMAPVVDSRIQGTAQVPHSFPRLLSLT